MSEKLTSIIISSIIIYFCFSCIFHSFSVINMISIFETYNIIHKTETLFLFIFLSVMITRDVSTTVEKLYETNN